MFLAFFVFEVFGFVAGTLDGSPITVTWGWELLELPPIFNLCIGGFGGAGLDGVVSALLVGAAFTGACGLLIVGVGFSGGGGFGTTGAVTCACCC